jgi:hypothetical protein
MFFGGTDQEARQINGLVFPHPALIFKLAGKDLFVRAMARTSRPGPEAPLKIAHYWNTDSWGLVCAGSYGEISYHGGFVNFATGATSVLRIDPEYWERMRRFSKRSSQTHHI